MTKTFFGYSSMTDFLASLTGIYSAKSLLLNSVSTVVLSLASFITKWVYPEPAAIVVLFAVLLGDWVTGMIRGTKSEDGFKTGLALRIFPKIAIYGLIIAGITAAYGVIGATIIYGGLMGITLTSLGRNSAELGYITGDVADFLKKYVDKNKTLK